MKHLKISLTYKVFLVFSGLIFVFNLLVLNDILSVLAGAEAENLYEVQQNKEGLLADSTTTFQLPRLVLEINYQELGFELFPLRLPNTFLLILSFFGVFWWGKKLFGQGTTLLMLLVLASSFLLISTAKFISFDIWLVSFQGISFFTLILLLKKPSWNWRILFWVSTLGAILVDAQSAIFFSLGLSLFLVFTHPKGKGLISVFDGLFWIAAIALVFVNGGMLTQGEGLYFHYSKISTTQYFLYQFMSVLPWIAFLPASIWDMIQKLRKREEMAIILFGFLVFSILSGGLIVQFAFALLIAKQIENYFKPNYPYTNFVKSVGVLNLGFAFFLVAVLLLTGYETYSEIGFRSRMGAGGVYWAFTFLSIIGLFGGDKKMIVGSMTLCGMLTMLLFWTQLAPRLEMYRNFPNRLTEAIIKINDGQQADVYLFPSVFETVDLSKRTQVYFNGKSLDYQVVPTSFSLENEKGIFVLDETAYLQLDKDLLKEVEKKSINGLQGTSDEAQRIWILKK